MSSSDRLLELVRDLLQNNALGLVTKDDLQKLEGRIDELTELVEAIEAKLDRKAS